MDGNVTFSWNGDPVQLYYVLITKDKATDPWLPVTGTQWTVKDALLYDSISIRVAVPGGATNNMTYKGILYMVYAYGSSEGIRNLTYKDILFTVNNISCNK